MAKAVKKRGFRFPMGRAEMITGLCFTALFITALPVLVELVFRLAWPKASAGAQNVALYILSFIIIIIGFHNYLKQSFRDILDAKLDALGAILLAYIGYYAAAYLMSLLLWLLGAGENPNTSAIFEQVRLNRGQVIVISVLLGPVVEETLFRGVVFGGIRQKSRAAAYIVSFLVFAFYHLWSAVLAGPSWGLLLTALEYLPASLALGWCYERSGSVWGPIILHCLINVVSVTVAWGW